MKYAWFLPLFRFLTIHKKLFSWLYYSGFKIRRLLSLTSFYFHDFSYLVFMSCIIVNALSEQNWSKLTTHDSIPGESGIFLTISILTIFGQFFSAQCDSSDSVVSWVLTAWRRAISQLSSGTYQLVLSFFLVIKFYPFSLCSRQFLQDTTWISSVGQNSILMVSALSAKMDKVLPFLSLNFIHFPSAVDNCCRIQWGQACHIPARALVPVLRAGPPPPSAP